MSFDISSLIIGMFFSLIGFAAFRYGKSMQSGKHMILGLALMGYSYLTPEPVTTFLIGAGLTGLLFAPI